MILKDTMKYDMLREYRSFIPKISGKQAGNKRETHGKKDSSQMIKRLSVCILYILHMSIGARGYIKRCDVQRYNMIYTTYVENIAINCSNHIAEMTQQKRE